MLYCHLLGAHPGLNSKVCTTNVYILFKIKSVGSNGLLLRAQNAGKEAAIKKKVCFCVCLKKNLNCVIFIFLLV